MRLFAAIDLPEEHLESVQRAVAPLAAELDGARWTDRVGWHVTVKFFGEVPDEEVDALAEAVGRAAGASPSVRSRLLDMGAFPSPRRARVLWVGIEDPAAALAELSAELSRATGHPPEQRAFHPHLTLARFRQPRSVEDLLRRMNPLEVRASPFSVDRLTLYRSRLSSKGARYEALRVFELSPGRSL